MTHRFLVFKTLSEEPLFPSFSGMSSIIVGLASDLWISCLLSIFICILLSLFQLFHKKPKKKLAFFLFWAWIILVTTMLGFHLNYVEFFHHQFIPAHLEYLIDTDFIRANGSSALTSATISFFAMAFFWVLILRRWSLAVKSSHLPFYILGFVASFLISLGSHSFNLIYRWRWFVPEKLRSNVIESFAVDLANPISRLKPLNFKELSTLSQIIGKRFSPKEPSSPASIMQEALTPQSFTLTPLGKQLKIGFEESIRTNKRPLIIVLLLESQRFYDVGKSPTQISLTPTLDALGEKGIFFTRAYSTAKITRAAQEATFCSHIGGEYYSLMRGTSQLANQSVACIPKLIKSQGGFSFWFHGGEPKFDSQVKFWKNQGLEKFLSGDDFSDQESRTGWGVSDRVLFSRSARELERLSTLDGSIKYFVGLILSISNHIPWTVPDDRPASLEDLSGRISGHPSYASARYADFALGEFVNDLKNKQLWEKTLLIVSGDHGHLAEPYRNDLISPSNPNYEEELLSHVPLIVSGGIGESAAMKINKHQVTAFVSHGSIFSFMAYILDLQTDVKADPLFAEPARLKVYSDLESRLYCPELAHKTFFRDIKGQENLEEYFLQHRFFIHDQNHAEENK